MKSKLLAILFLITPVVSDADTVWVDKDWFNNSFQPDSPLYVVTASFQAIVPDTMSPGQSGTVYGSTSKTGGYWIPIES